MDATPQLQPFRVQERLEDERVLPRSENVRDHVEVDGYVRTAKAPCAGSDTSYAEHEPGKHRPPVARPDPWPSPGFVGRRRSGTYPRRKEAADA